MSKRRLSNEDYANRRRELSSWLLSLPALAWLIVFFSIPYFIIFVYSFFKAGLYNIETEFTFNAYRELLNPNYIRSLYISLRLATYTTILCIIFGYPAAYFIARASEKLKNFLLLLIIIPFWTNFIIRIFSWRIFLAPEGLLNNLLMSIQLIETPLRLLRTDFAVLLVMVYVYLPYMVLPLYANIEKIDFSLLNAAMDLGAKPFKAFMNVTLPLSKQGLLAGTILVFIPSLGAYVIPQLVGHQHSLFIGQIITYNVKNIPRNWPVASALSFVLLVIITIILLVFYYLNLRIKRRGFS
jgi:spermidine/putrescine transport system permease protein